MLAVFGCASTHPGQIGKQVAGPQKDLQVSADPIAEYSDSTNVVLDFTLENKGTRWLRIDQVQLEFPNESNVVHNIIVGDDLKIWAESYANKRKRDNYNKDLGIAGLVLTGVTVAILGNRSSDVGYSSAGLAVASAGGVWGSQKTVRDRQLKAQTSEVVPENYVLAPMTIPSQGFLRRWVLVNIPDKLIAKNAILILKTIEGDVLRYEIPIHFHGSDIK